MNALATWNCLIETTHLTKLNVCKKNKKKTQKISLLNMDSRFMLVSDLKTLLKYEYAITDIE